MKFKRAVKRFFSLPVNEKLIFSEAAFLLLFWHLTVKLLPFGWYKGFLGKRVKEPPQLEANSKPELVHKIGRAIIAGARYLPWHPVCFPQALACKSMLNLRRLKSVLFLGAAPGEGLKLIELHSWLVCGTEVVTGKKESERYKVIQIYQ